MRLIYFGNNYDEFQSFTSELSRAAVVIVLSGPCVLLTLVMMFRVVLACRKSLIQNQISTIILSSSHQQRILTNSQFIESRKDQFSSQILNAILQYSKMNSLPRITGNLATQLYTELWCKPRQMRYSCCPVVY